MKKFIVLFLTLFATFVAFGATQVAEPEPVFNMGQFFVSLASIAAITPVITQFILNRLNTKFDQLVSWAVSLLLCAFGWVFKLGIFDGVEWYWIFINGVAAGLVANGIFDIAIIKALLSFIPKRKDKE